jgi:hypothetical protein
MTRILWTVQILLALVFLFSGAMKLVLPLDVLAQQTPLPGALVRFIGICETLGAIGLILPAMLRIRPALTPLAATCLAILMACATVLTPPLMGAIGPAALPLALGLLAAFVAYGRSRLAPIQPSARPARPARRAMLQAN